LRAMNMLYEGLKRQNATIVIVPSTAIETMQLGGPLESRASPTANAQTQSSDSRGGASGRTIDRS